MNPPERSEGNNPVSIEGDGFVISPDLSAEEMRRQSATALVVPRTEEAVRAPSGTGRLEIENSANSQDPRVGITDGSGGISAHSPNSAPRLQEETELAGQMSRVEGRAICLNQEGEDLNPVELKGRKRQRPASTTSMPQAPAIPSYRRLDFQEPAGM